MWNGESKLAEYIQFRKDAQESTHQECKDWSYKKFSESGYVRCRLTENRLCYAKKFSGLFNFIFGKDEILFSFKG